MLVIVGLGNWSKEYQGTRHNIGFLVLDQLLPQVSPNKDWQKNSRTGCLEVRGENFLLVKPQTFMNLTGQAVKKLVNFYQINSSNLLFVHDDLDLVFGEIKISKKQGPAGHHGVESIVRALGTNNFWRARIGIGRPGESRDPGRIADFVLERFSQREKKVLELVIEEAAKQLVLAIEKGVEEVKGKKEISI